MIPFLEDMAELNNLINNIIFNWTILEILSLYHVHLIMHRGKGLSVDSFFIKFDISLCEVVEE